MEQENWQSLSPNEVLNKLKTSNYGLSEEEVHSRQKVYGFNELSKRKKKNI